MDQEIDVRTTAKSRLEQEKKAQQRKELEEKERKDEERRAREREARQRAEQKANLKRSNLSRVPDNFVRSNLSLSLSLFLCVAHTLVHQKFIGIVFHAVRSGKCSL
jgi:uncharacterized membrane protein YdbT with pleckstrin-like domain